MVFITNSGLCAGWSGQGTRIRQDPAVHSSNQFTLWPQKVNHPNSPFGSLQHQYHINDSPQPHRDLVRSHSSTGCVGIPCYMWVLCRYLVPLHTSRSNLWSTSHMGPGTATEGSHQYTQNMKYFFPFVLQLDCATGSGSVMSLYQKADIGPMTPEVTLSGSSWKPSITLKNRPEPREALHLLESWVDVSSHGSHMLIYLFNKYLDNAYQCYFGLFTNISAFSCVRFWKLYQGASDMWGKHSPSELPPPTPIPFVFYFELESY